MHSPKVWENGAVAGCPWASLPVSWLREVTAVTFSVISEAEH